jgi:DNA-binding NarL/FixJ family response regulator
MRVLFEQAISTMSGNALSRVPFAECDTSTTPPRTVTTSSTAEKRFVLIISNGLFSQCLLTSFRMADPGVVYEAHSSISSWRSAASAPRTSIVILFASTSGEGDASVLNRDALRIGQTAPAVRYVVMSDRDEPQEILQAIKTGAQGFIPTTMEVQTIVRALHFVDSGGVFVPAASLLALSEASKSGNGPTTDSGPLSPKEMSVAVALGKGAPNKIIAYELNLCESTVKVHVRNIMKKLKARNRTEIALISRKLFPQQIGK